MSKTIKQGDGNGYLKEDGTIGMMRGYCDGLKDERLDLPVGSNYSQQYAHGWYNGRDDRIGKPRSGYGYLKTMAELLIAGDL